MEIERYYSWGVRYLSDELNILNSLMHFVGIAWTTYTIYYAYAFPFRGKRFAAHTLGLGLFLFYLVQIKDKIDSSSRNIIIVYILLLSILSGIYTIYIELNFMRLSGSALISGFTTLDYLFAFIIIYIATDATYRAFGRSITIFLLMTYIYAFFGSYLPGILNHPGMSPANLGEVGALDLTGVHGFITVTGTTVVAIFIMFAGIAKEFGILIYVQEVAYEIRKKLKTGIAHMAVLTSLVMGMITGASTANTATTGAFTIPLMKDQGISKEFAAGIESISSSGGQIMPPIMGIAAFLIADILTIPYADVIKSALIPALMFYFVLGYSVQLLIYKKGWLSKEKGNIEYDILLNGIHYFIPILLLVYLLIGPRYSPLSAAFYTIAATILIKLIELLITEDGFISWLLESFTVVLKGLSQGAKDMAPIVPILASLGIVVAIVSFTGLATRLSVLIASVGGETLILALLITMVSSILFGMGLPTPVAYLLVAVLAAPGIVRLGVPELSAHLFVLYYAMLSAITPPICVALIIAIDIADANFYKTAKQTLRIAAPTFLIPFIFVLNDVLIFWSFETLFVFPLMVIGLAAMVHSLIGVSLKNSSLIIPTRLLLLAISLGIFFLNLRYKIALSLVFIILSACIDYQYEINNILGN